MKNFLKFLIFVVLVSLGISLLYDYQLHHGHLSLSSRKTPEKYTLASQPSARSFAGKCLVHLFNVQPVEHASAGGSTMNPFMNRKVLPSGSST